MFPNGGLSSLVLFSLLASRLGPSKKIEKGLTCEDVNQVAIAKIPDLCDLGIPCELEEPIRCITKKDSIIKGKRRFLSCDDIRDEDVEGLGSACTLSGCGEGVKGICTNPGSKKKILTCDTAPTLPGCIAFRPCVYKNNECKKA